MAVNAIEGQGVPPRSPLHALELEVRPIEGQPPKFYVRCSCGYRAAVRRSERAAAEAAAVHLRRVRPVR